MIKSFAIATFVGVCCVAPGCSGKGASAPADAGAGAPDAAADAAPAASPVHVELTWLGVTTWLAQFDGLNVLLDAYFSRPQFGPLGTNEGGTKYLAKVLAAAGVTHLDYILVGHSHYDHAMDTGTAALAYGAQVIGSQTTCFIAEAQGLPSSRCTVVKSGSTLTVGGAQVRAVRIIHWGPTGVGVNAELTAPPVAPFDTFKVFITGGTYGFLFNHAGAKGPVVWYWSGSLGSMSDDDGSHFDYKAELKSAFTGLPPAAAWIGAVDAAWTTDAAVLSSYLDVIRPRAVIPQHWESTYDGDPTAGVTSSFPDSPTLAGLLSAQGATLLPQAQYFERRVITEAGVEAHTASAVRSAFGL